MKDLLIRLHEKGLHLHEMPQSKNEVSEIYKHYAAYMGSVISPIPYADVLYAMCGKDIVHVGNLYTLDSFIQRFKEEK